MKSNNRTLLFLITLSLLSIIGSYHHFINNNIDWMLLIPMVLLTLMAEVFKTNIMIYKASESVSVSWTMVFSIGTLIGLGVPSAIIVNVISGLVSSIYPKKLDIKKLIYNVTAQVSTIILSDFFANKYLTYTGESIIISSIIVAFTYMFINYSLGLILMKLVTNKRIKDIIIDIILPHAPHSLILSIIGALLGITYVQDMFFSLIGTLFLVYLIILSLKMTAMNANKRIEELDRTIEELIQTLTTTIDARDPYVYGHSLQVSTYSTAIAAEMNLSDEDIYNVKVAGLLHDIGKISISESILFKKGRLTDDEYNRIKQHSLIGEEIISKISSLNYIAKLIGMHHERYDGRGYPLGLKKDEIPICAHILGVSDSLDAILSDRSYKSGRSLEEAINEIKRCKGTQFHPDVVDAFLRLSDKKGNEIFKNSASLVEQKIK